jgi:hypothetical protein
MRSSEIPDRFFIVGWSLDSMVTEKNQLLNSMNQFKFTHLLYSCNKTTVLETFADDCAICSDPSMMAHGFSASRVMR